MQNTDPSPPGEPSPTESRDPNRVRLHPDRLRISGDGVFYTLQGEGITLGLPAVFLRLHVCNLRCGWCDTPYTWNPDEAAFWTESEEWTPEETAHRIQVAWGCEDAGTPSRLVLTGGEPLLQSEAIDRVLELLPDWEVEIETNGTRIPSPLQRQRGLFNCSPKLAHSGNSSRARIRPDALKTINAARSQFKFVVREPEDIEEVLRDFGPMIDRRKIVLMPEGTSATQLQAGARRVAETAKQHGLRLLPRLQVDLWGSQRRT